MENNRFDEYEVRDWLGHTEIGTSLAYLRDAKQYYRQASYNWIKRVLKFHKSEELNTLNSRKG